MQNIYKLENNINFYEELNKQENETSNEEKCLITGEKLMNYKSENDTLLSFFLN